VQLVTSAKRHISGLLPHEAQLSGEPVGTPDRPSEDDVQTLAASMPELTWASLRPERHFDQRLRPPLLNHLA
jgi:hypothetical protein